MKKMPPKKAMPTKVRSMGKRLPDPDADGDPGSAETRAMEQREMRDMARMAARKSGPRVI